MMTGPSSLILNKYALTWPKVIELYHLRWINYTDIALTETLLKKNPTPSEETALFLIHLSSATREGHLCIEVSNENVYPTPKSCWRATEGQIMTEEMSEALSKLIVKAAHLLPKNLVSDAATTEQRVIIQEGNSFYFQKYWSYHSEVEKQLSLLHQTPPTLKIDLERLHHKLFKMNLLPEQQQAIEAAATHTLTVLCGGPGTGKTHTAGQMIRLFLELLTEQERSCKIIVTAPTGKAATNLEQSIKKAFSQNNTSLSPENIKAQTLHALLGLKKRPYKIEESEIKPIDGEIILVDECSMIDIELFYYLIHAVRPGARLILLGDRFQLPPIGAGAPFAKLLDHLHKKSPKQAIELKKCLRTDLKSIINLAEAVNRGEEFCLDADQVMGNSDRPLCYVAIENTKQMQHLLVEYTLPLFAELNAKPMSDEELLVAANQFRILSPLRQGLFGVETLNKLIMEKILKMVRGRESYATPILITQNNYKLDLFNGDTGVLIKAVSHKGSRLTVHDYALFPGKGDEAPRRLPAPILPSYEHSYALSVHKSQGSEFNHVLVVMPQGAEAFGREMFYTALTRARKRLEIWGEKSVIDRTIQNSNQKF